MIIQQCQDEYKTVLEKICSNSIANALELLQFLAVDII